MEVLPKHLERRSPQVFSLRLWAYSEMLKDTHFVG